ncbi:sporulation integral membrane protein YlbJ [Bacillus massiliglaciei]|uniref:sporulation integral membrane protein YlbJ n=1 Tax=Bacillus massiliglaciei TaxID=1816693 RepID=UPI000A3D9AE4|nr:sporulation integral membrane protein YlbJ [Bacillus massiliglaciei]
MFKSKLKSLIMGLSLTLMACGLILFPQDSFEASKNGLNMWWQVVFPSLLPFLILSELLISFGVVKFLGVMLEPLMRPLFRVPGAGGFVWAMGLASGFPAGAKFTARLRQEEQLTRIEAERLVCFTNSSNPLFIFVAVSVGFFHNAKIGIILALAHYLGNVLVGFIMRFYGRKEEEHRSAKQLNRLPSLREAFSQMHKTRIREKRPFGKLLGDAVISSINTQLMIGGFIILFSVISEVLVHLHLSSMIAEGSHWLLALFSFPEALGLPVISGLFEMTLGANLISETKEATLVQQIVLTSFILAFSGFSIQAQVASIIADTDIRFFPFFAARILQGIISAIIAYLVCLYMGRDGISASALPVSGWIEREASPYYQSMIEMGPLFTLFFLTLYVIIFSRRIVMK